MLWIEEFVVLFYDRVVDCETKKVSWNQISWEKYENIALLWLKMVRQSNCGRSELKSFTAREREREENSATKKSLASYGFNEQYQNVKACQKIIRNVWMTSEIETKGKNVNAIACAFGHITNPAKVSHTNVYVCLLRHFVCDARSCSHKTFQEFLIFDLFTFTIRSKFFFCCAQSELSVGLFVRGVTVWMLAVKCHAITMSVFYCQMLWSEREKRKCFIYLSCHLFEWPSMRNDTASERGTGNAS